MTRRRAYVLAIAMFALLSAGCRIFGPRVVSVTGIAPPRPGGPPRPIQLPVMQLEYNGAAVQGLQAEYQWQTPNGAMAGRLGGVPPPASFPGLLTVPAGQSVNILFNHSSLPPAYVVVELDTQGTPLDSYVLAPAASGTPLQPTQSGRLVIQVTAQWSWEEYIVYLFAIDVQ